MQIITIVIGIYLTILIANMGGYVDTILKAEIQETVNAEIAALAAQQPMSPEARAQLIASEIAEREHLAGLDQPFFPPALCATSETRSPCNLDGLVQWLATTAQGKSRILSLNACPQLCC